MIQIQGTFSKLLMSLDLMKKEGIRLLQQVMYNNQAQKNEDEEDEKNSDNGHENIDENNIG